MQTAISIGATVVIVREGQVLMTKREDYEVWCLPGGHSDPDESLAATAIREAKEEVGLDVELTRFVGVYSRLGAEKSIHLSVFMARPVAGIPTPQVDEVLDIRYFDPARLPRDMFWWHRQPIIDALAGVAGAAYTAIVEPPQQVYSRQELYALRDRSGLSRTAFYHHYFESGNNSLVRNV